MTPQERQMLADLFERVKAAGATPRDAEAERFISDAVKETPFAPYVLSQTVLVQQQALEAAARRLAELEQAARQGGEEQHTSFLGNLGKSLFGGGPAPHPPEAPPRQTQGYGPPPLQQGYGAPPPQGYGPPPRGPWGAPSGGGGGFLQTAAGTAAGVAGGVALGSLLGNLFGGHSGAGLFGGGFGGAGFPAGGETINNFYEVEPGRRDDQGPVEPSMPDDAGYIDDASFDDGSSFDDSSGGGYDDV